MNWQIFTPGKSFIKILGCLLCLLLISDGVVADWEVDFSRRSNKIRKDDMRAPASAPMSSSEEKPLKDRYFDFLFAPGEPIQEVVVLHTDRGFVPSTVRVREGLKYNIFVVNVNSDEKNVSFVLDSFSEHHGTYFGKLKSFFIRPRKEGVYTFYSPETAAKGKLVVYPSAQPRPQEPSLRRPASEQ